MNSSNSHTNRFEELCAAYVLDALEPGERQEFEQMMADADQQQTKTYHSLQSAANNLALAIDPAEPPTDVKKQLMKRIRSDAAQSNIDDSDTEKGTGNTYSRFSFAMSIAASTILLLISLAFIIYSITLHSKVNNQHTTITKLQNEVQKKQRMLSILGARTVDLVIMKGQKVNPAGYGKIIWDPKNQKALLQVANLPTVPANKDYQLWLIKNGKPIPAGVFDVNGTSKNSFFAIQQLAKANQQNANAFAVTLEPKGGSPQPTGDMYLQGSVKKD
jgi:anti-sigma-K factor RskA